MSRTTELIFVLIIGVAFAAQGWLLTVRTEAVRRYPQRVHQRSRPWVRWLWEATPG